MTTVVCKNPKNNQIIDNLQSYRSQMKDTLAKGKYKPYTAHNIQFVGDKIIVNGSKLTKKAESKILRFLGLASTYKNVSEKMDPTDWSDVTEKFCDALSSNNFYASHSTKTVKDEKTGASNSVSEIEEILLPTFSKNDKERLSTESINGSTADVYAESVINTLIRNIAAHDSTINMHPTSEIFLDNSVNFNFVIDDYKLNVFNSGLDEWTKGFSMQFNKHEFALNPFFNRLVCTNGATTDSYGLNTNTHKSNFTLPKIEKAIDNAFVNNLMYDSILFQRINDMRDFNISIAELEEFTKVFANNMEENEFAGNKMLMNMFNTSYLTAAYRIPIEDMDKKMKQTADTGKNAYRFFNDITWLASHRQESGISTSLCRSLQIHAGKFLFKKQFDMAMIAPKPNFNDSDIKYISN